jgi:adenine-specific DNA-methyltransferase
MSYLTNLIARVKAKDAALGDDLEREIKALASRRAFGLNFERHRPESVELPGRNVRRGDKVRVLPPRGSTQFGDQRLWLVTRIEGASEARVAKIALIDAETPESAEVAVADLVVVAEFRDFIYPGLISTGRVTRGGDKPFHTLINGENFHVLEALTYTHRGKIDAIYIDPPYNTGARDWRYNNDFVEAEDLYRHSKWLAFMERRLRVAATLLNQEDSVLIVTIDEKEYLRLGLLLEQTFEGSQITMISSVINPKGTGRQGDFARTNEFIFFVRFGRAAIGTRKVETNVGNEVAWETMRRRNLASVRGRKGRGACGPNQFYPIYVCMETGAITGRGEPLPPDQSRTEISPPSGCIAVFPVRPDGTEMNWEYMHTAFDKWFSKGFIRANGARPEPQQYIIQHLPNKARKEITTGAILIDGRRGDGAVIAKYADKSTKTVTTQWDLKSHSAEHGGTGILKSLIPARLFPFPKSLFAVEDAIRLIVADKPHAVILDFFAGSGTTAHAVMRLNRQDGGQRQCISVTNNEVAADEQTTLRKAGLRPGDPDWEKLGICDFITKPRIAAAITGKTPEGNDIEGDYKFTDEFPMSEGFEENAEFFTLSYESQIAVGANLAFQRIAPLLWMRAGSRGRRIDDLPDDGWDVADTYGLLVDLDRAVHFCEAVASRRSVRLAYVVTDDDRRFQAVARALPNGVEAVRLYESYLSNFRFSMGR